MLRAIGLTILCWLLPALLPAQDTIVANPKAWKLRRVWKIQGHDTVGGMYWLGGAGGGVGDLNGDSIGDFACFVRGAWNIYFGGPALDTIPEWSKGGFSVYRGPSHPVTGNFWGTKQKGIGFSKETEGDTNVFQFHVFQIHDGKIDATPAAIMDPFHSLKPSIGTNVGPQEIIAQDLDGDGADELIVVLSSHFTGSATTPDRHGEIWIYKGGPGFQLDTPTLIVRDPEENRTDAFYPVIGDIDGDHRPDLIIGAQYADGVFYKFWFSTSGSPWNWTIPDRVITIPDAANNIDPQLWLLDCDGDGISDIARAIFFNEHQGVYLFRSGSGKDVRQRSFLADSADIAFHTPSSPFVHVGGHLNDSSNRYDMLMIENPSPFYDGSTTLFGFSGGPNGPDTAYDCFYDPALDRLTDYSIFSRADRPIGDVTGDGYEDYFCTNIHWFGNDNGIAVVLAGGPEIPRDSTTLGVRDLELEGKTGALSLWPNPVIDELNIAWRGDLTHAPSRFVVHDLLGRPVAEGSVDPSAGAAIWRCAGQPSGVYLLSIFDRHGVLLGAARISKR